MRQFANQRAFFQPPGEFGRPEAGFPNAQQLLMLAIERAMAPPVFHLRTTLQPMRVIVIQPDSPDSIVQHNGASENFGAHALLPLSQATESLTYPEAEFRQRVVQGEILSDEQGNLYEKLGHGIRPIHQLASGPAGELIEVAPVGQARLRLLGAPAGPRIVGRQPRTNVSPEHEANRSAGKAPSTSAFIPLGPTPEKTATPTHRKLFADPGQWRVVWWGEFKEILAQQLAHPERLRDSYRLPCYVQVFETERAVSLQELAAAYALESGRQTPLYFLTDEIATKLDLGSLLPPLAVRPVNEERTSRSLLPHDRVFRLLAANDPTVDVATLKRSSEPPESKTVSKAEVAAAPKAALKQEIPSRFVKDWEFKISREEALYDMNATATPGNLVRSFFRRFRIFKLRSELRKWQALLAGKDLDEQLWGVRPPRELAQALVREWLEGTLVRGGYDSQKMSSEWEIFWRRKQV
jgi:hypothetical protein